MTTTSRIGRAAVFVLLCLIGISTIYPLVFMALNSMRTTQQFEVSPYGLPKHFTTADYHSLLSQVPFFQSILHSIIVVVPAVILATLCSALMAFVLTKTPVKLGNFLFWVMLTVMFMPGIVVLLPLYVRIAHMGLANNFAPAIFLYTAISIPYGTYLLRSNFRAIPDSVIEAARVDGGSWTRIFIRVVLPIAKPGIVTVGILTFLNIWNELFISLVLLHQPNNEMVTPTLANLSGKFSSDVPVIMAGLLIGAVPTLLVYLVSARVFIRGMLAGAIR
ncbi:MAG TPA: carbohydrate ABC transporter permease [Mycobacteriales bacterium]|nr:carbohydrate ABC transporter permease [Mycobacteriales bacterium]